jgi:hypothetical protein
MAVPLNDTLAGRRDQMFPVLSESDLARAARFGSLHTYAAGDYLFRAGQPAETWSTRPTSTSGDGPKRFWAGGSPAAPREVTDRVAALGCLPRA